MKSWVYLIVIGTCFAMVLPEVAADGRCGMMLEDMSQSIAPVMLVVVAVCALLAYRKREKLLVALALVAAALCIFRVVAMTSWKISTPEVHNVQRQ